MVISAAALYDDNQPLNSALRGTFGVAVLDPISSDMNAANRNRLLTETDQETLDSLVLNPYQRTVARQMLLIAHGEHPGELINFLSTLSFDDLTTAYDTLAEIGEALESRGYDYLNTIIYQELAMLALQHQDFDSAATISILTELQTRQDEISQILNSLFSNEMDIAELQVSIDNATTSYDKGMDMVGLDSSNQGPGLAPDSGLTQLLGKIQGMMREKLEIEQTPKPAYNPEALKSEMKHPTPVMQPPAPSPSMRMAA